MLLAGYHTGHWLETVVEEVETYHDTWPMIAVEDWASIAGALILVGIGSRMIKENLGGGERSATMGHPLQGVTLILLAISVSLDALAAGFSMGMMDVNLVKLCGILGIVIFCIAVISLGLGRKFGRLIGARAELVGGVLLILLGIHVFWTALSS
jgi:putative Mn2+ efflux pump MntP